jgi:hypothetical protein
LALDNVPESSGGHGGQWKGLYRGLLGTIGRVIRVRAVRILIGAHGRRGKTLGKDE